MNQSTNKKQKVLTLAEQVHEVGYEILNCDANSNGDRDCRSLFGVSEEVCVSVWDLLEPETTMPKGVAIKHLFWALMFLKTYGNEATLCSLAGGVSKNTFHKWSWIMIDAISYLEPYVVSKDNNNLNFFTFF